MDPVKETLPPIPPTTEKPSATPPRGSVGGGVAELAAEHAEGFPTPDPQAAEAELRKLALTLDPEVYVIKDGLPVLNKDNTPKKKTGPKKPDAAQTPGSMGMEFEALGMVAAETIFSICTTTFGEEWQPGDEERQRLYHAWGVYLKAKGINDLPPGIVLLGAMQSYARPRLTKPETKGKINEWKSWVAKKILRRG